MSKLNQNKRTDLAYYAFKGCRVAGLKHGVPFSGVVVDHRWMTTQPNTIIVHIKTDSPVLVLGDMVDSFCMEYCDTDWLADNHYIDFIEESTYPNK